jgi:hypothetical protein
MACQGGYPGPPGQLPGTYERIITRMERSSEQGFGEGCKARYGYMLWKSALEEGRRYTYLPPVLVHPTMRLDAHRKDPWR